MGLFKWLGLEEPHVSWKEITDVLNKPENEYLKSTMTSEQLDYVETLEMYLRILEHE